MWSKLFVNGAVLLVILLVAGCGTQGDPTPTIAPSRTSVAATDVLTATVTSTPFPSETPVDVDAGAPEVRGGCTVRVDWTFTYVARAGDTLSSIARRADVITEALAAGNCIETSSMVVPGQELRTPLSLESQQLAATSTMTSTPINPAGPRSTIEFESIPMDF